MAKCRVCGHKWEPRTKEPVACPKCKRYDWKEPIKILSVIIAFIFILPIVQAINITQPVNYSVYIHGSTAGGYSNSYINLTDDYIRNNSQNGWANKFLFIKSEYLFIKSE